MKPYNKANVPLAKALRKNMTPWERKLWYLFLRSCPVRFQRQKPIGNYIVDFYCAKAKLAIELDGSGHYEPEAALQDAQRTKRLENMGVHVMRFTNHEIDSEFYAVCQTIDTEVKKRLGSLGEGAVSKAD